MAAPLPLVLKDLTKTYGKARGIEALNLEIAPGQIFGFLGPNGAGKSTAIRTIMNFLKPTSGQALVFGLDSVNSSTEIKSKVGYLAGDFELYDNLTGWQYLEFIAHLRNVTHVKKQISELEAALEAQLDKRLGTLSRGNMQKIALMAALLHDPDLLILDEPTTGLDPLMQNKFYDLVRERVSRGKTVFMSSHILSEVQAICDQVAFMKHGRLAETINVEQLRNSRKKEVRIRSDAKSGKLPRPTFKDVQIITHTQRELIFTTAEPSKALLRWLSIQQAADVTIQEVSLQDVFLKLYAEAAEEAHV